MKKVINITLGGTVFAIEADAYEKLDEYLQSIRNTLSSEDSSEVIQDIESAVAEKFIKSKRNEHVAVTVEDVGRVIIEMGNASEFSEETPVEEVPHPPKAPVSSQKKRLYRDTEDSVLGGVASGIAQYFDLDPVIVRLIFFISIFLNGFGIVAYLVLWLVVPRAETTTEKYAMRGERVTVSHITERVKQKIENFGEGNTQHAKTAWSRARSWLVRFFAFLGNALKLIFHSLRYIVGVALLLFGAVGIAITLASTVGVATGTTLIRFDPLAQELIDQLFVRSFDGLILLIGTALVLLIPLIFIIIAGTSLLRGVNRFTAGTTISLFIIWVIAIIVAAVIGTRYAPQIIEKDWEELTPIACTMEAKVCPDGSAVGRTGPHCQFALCPGAREDSNSPPIEEEGENSALPTDIGMEFPTIENAVENNETDLNFIQR